MEVEKNTLVMIVTPEITCTVKGGCGDHLDDLITLVKQCLLGLGFHSDTVKEYIE